MNEMKRHDGTTFSSSHKVMTERIDRTHRRLTGRHQAEQPE
jgi:hypothetical protein